MTGSITALVLAAGTSSRMGSTNKLLLKFNEQSMVSHVIDQLMASKVDHIIVITGNDAEKVKGSIRQNVSFSHNPDYNKGLSTSVKVGITALGEDCTKDCEAVMICLGDMPYIMAADYNKLIDAFKKDKIIAPTSNGKIGNPLIFSARFFKDFMDLDGDKGARKLLKKYSRDVIEVDVNSDAIFSDIDTPKDYENI